MKKAIVLLLAAAAIVVGAATIVAQGGARAASTSMMTSVASPTTGFTLHIDALKHFPDHPSEVAHHWCKALTGMFECQIYDSDGPKAHLVEIEMVVPAATWKTFPPAEQKLWHYHRVEIPKVDAKLPGMAPADAAKVLASLQETYGKVYLIWDPMSSKLPTGQPSVAILH
ncbi:MAG TPA: DUF1264 domain-containing protein [Trinickia sp.]|jgi:hypothetical protein|nr:DUF1264 domain-containing protein [Trinickia sp.]